MFWCPGDLQLQLMVDERLDESMRMVVESHVELCPRCSLRLERIVVREIPLHVAAAVTDEASASTSLCPWIHHWLDHDVYGRLDAEEDSTCV